jgi:hypothetical protein
MKLQSAVRKGILYTHNIAGMGELCFGSRFKSYDKILCARLVVR